MKWNDDLPFDSWATWKAWMLNHLFFEQGKMREPARITGRTVKHGESTAGATEGHTIDPWPISEWGPECQRGFPNS